MNSLTLGDLAKWLLAHPGVQLRMRCVPFAEYLDEARSPVFEIAIWRGEHCASMMGKSLDEMLRGALDFSTFAEREIAEREIARAGESTARDSVPHRFPRPVQGEEPRCMNCGCKVSSGYHERECRGRDERECRAPTPGNAARYCRQRFGHEGPCDWEAFGGKAGA